MPELLLEVGCEELPAAFVRKAYTDLHDRVAAAMAELYGESFKGEALGTPRRLIISFSDVPARQPDAIKEVRGPALKAAYGESGEPTPALLGFCRSNGAEPTDLRKDEQYVWLTKSIVGQPTDVLLADIMPKAIKGLTFEKSMRWGSARLRFARPLRWLLAAYDGKVVKFEIEGVKSGAESRGHRFYAPAPFTAATLKELTDGLRKRKVEPDVEARAASIIDQAGKMAGGTPDLPNDLVDENAFLTEWPTAVVGEFRPEHLSLPGPVLTTAMAKHERMFPVRDADEKLTNRFVFVRNSGEDDSVRKGAEWVLNARLDDAQFFFREDAKHDLDYFLEKTSGIVFQEKLGTVRERADRLEALAMYVAEQTGASSNENKWAKLAGKYAKADLSTGLVSDMSSLQGVVGGEYAKLNGLPEPVCWAIASHYDHTKNLKPDSEGARTSQRLSIADSLDKLVGFLGLGLVPTGSSDPFALRRAATVLIETAWNWDGVSIDYLTWIQHSAQLYREQGKPIEYHALDRPAEELFVGRYAALLSHVRHDILEAATALGSGYWARPAAIPVRIAALDLLVTDHAFVQTATRPLNIVDAARKKGFATSGENSIDRIDSKEGLKLWGTVDTIRREIVLALGYGNPADAASEAKKLLAPINSFMDSTMIMVDVESVRTARLEVLARAGDALLQIGDFTRIVIDG